MRNTIFIFCVLFLAGCASSSPVTCNLQHIQQLGASDAMSGLVAQNRSAVSSCSNEAPLAYRMGFETGLERFCTYEMGLHGGQHGMAAAQSCGDAKWEQYSQGFLTGREILATNQQLETIASQMELTRKHLSEAQSHVGSGPLQSIDIQRVNELRKDIAVLSAERDAANRRLFTLRSDFSHSRKRELSSL